MSCLCVSALDRGPNAVEVVERKGLGHPDTICDALAEALSRNLCRAYRERYGIILHHNVDKALLCGGSAAPALGGGKVLDPIEVYLAGRATAGLGGEAIPIREIAVEGSRAWLRANLRALDAQRDVRIHDRIRAGSQDLQELFARRPRQGLPLANDTVVGVGYAPLSQLERLVLSFETSINGSDRGHGHPAWGEDVKVMGTRQGDRVLLTVACAMIGKHLPDIEAYLAAKSALESKARERATECGFPACEVSINAADDVEAKAIYLTVTGTSAESGDDGQVGRGNRVNGLITPYRPMVLEAVAGKNPVSHVGKIYNVLAREIAETLVAAVPDIAATECIITSRIGAPITEPELLHVGIVTRDGIPAARMEPAIRDIAEAALRRAPKLVDDFIAGTINVY